MSATLNATIWLTPYQKFTNPGNNPYYPKGATQAAWKIIKDTWERDQFGFIICKKCQHLTKKNIIAEALPELLEEKIIESKLFAGILGHELMEYLRLLISKYFKRIEDYEQLVDDLKFPWQPEKCFRKITDKWKNTESSRINISSG